MTQTPCRTARPEPAKLLSAPVQTALTVSLRARGSNLRGAIGGRTAAAIGAHRRPGRWICPASGAIPPINDRGSLSRAWARG